jgi:hypothetical protein
MYFLSPRLHYSFNSQQGPPLSGLSDNDTLPLDSSGEMRGSQIEINL